MGGQPQTRNRLFWKIGGLSLFMLLVGVMLVDLYVVRALRAEYLEAAFARLESLSQLAVQRRPQSLDRAALQEWARWVSRAGVRATVVGTPGIVLADSAQDPTLMENHGSREEIHAAFADGLGRAVRYSGTQRMELVYFARRFSPGGPPMVVRLASPVHRLDQGVAAFRTRLWGISLAILALTGGMSLLFFRRISNRIERLTDFSRRIADGDFRPMPLERSRDELADLSRSLNRTAAELHATIRTLTDERNQSAAVLASMEEGVLVVNTQQRIIYCNGAFCRGVEVFRSDWVGRPIVELVRHSDLLAMVGKVLSTGEVLQGEITVGSVRTRSFAATSAPIRSDDVSVGAVMVLHDITEIRRLERARRDFVANVSHEFRTPLTAVRGFAETLLDGALEDSDRRRRFIEIIHEHALRLGRLTDDLLRLAQIEAGKLHLELRPISVSALIEPCVETTRVKAEQKGIAFEAPAVADAPAVVGDVCALQGVLQELLDNAVRYSSQSGRIAIATAVQGQEVAISVSDTGIGIPKADQERIFERFYRTDPARSRESGGTGLGLSIAKHMIEAHNGRITVESEVGKGAVFTVFLPAAQRS